MKHLKLFENFDKDLSWENWERPNWTNKGYLMPEDIGGPDEVIVAWTSNDDGDALAALCTLKQAQKIQALESRNQDRRMRPKDLKILPAEGMAYVTIGPNEGGGPREIRTLSSDQGEEAAKCNYFVTTASRWGSESMNENPDSQVPETEGATSWTFTLKRGKVLVDGSSEFRQLDAKHVYNYTTVWDVDEFIINWAQALRIDPKRL